MTEENTGQQLGTESALSTYVGPYVTEMLGRGQALGSMDYQGYGGRLTRAGAFGGSRQAIMESEGNRNLLQNLAGITGLGYRDAFDKAQAQFNVEQDRGQAAQRATNEFGLAALQKQADLGSQQRSIEQAGIDADYAQFEEERDFPYKQVQYMQSLLQGLPLATQSYTYAEPSQLSQIMQTSGGLMELYNNIFG